MSIFLIRSLASSVTLSHSGDGNYQKVNNQITTLTSVLLSRVKKEWHKGVKSDSEAIDIGRILQSCGKSPKMKAQEEGLILYATNIVNRSSN